MVPSQGFTGGWVPGVGSEHLGHAFPAEDEGEEVVGHLGKLVLEVRLLKRLERHRQHLMTDL